MKNIICIALFALILASCAESEKPQATTDAVMHSHEHPVAAVESGDVDPVCGMVRDSTWTEYALHEGDTVWFCAAPEKKAFLANPSKYTKAKGL